MSSSTDLTLEERVTALETAISLDELPLGQLKQWLELEFQPEASTFLLPHSVTEDNLTVAYAQMYTGTGSPQTVVIANIGAIYRDLAGGAGSTFYVKEADSGLNTGWAAK